jgi:hypothetical protein
VLSTCSPVPRVPLKDSEACFWNRLGGGIELFLADSAARKLADDFFGALNAKLAGPFEASDPNDEDGAELAEESSAAAMSRRQLKVGTAGAA